MGARRGLSACGRDEGFPPRGGGERRGAVGTCAQLRFSSFDWRLKRGKATKGEKHAVGKICYIGCHRTSTHPVTRMGFRVFYRDRSLTLPPLVRSYIVRFLPLSNFMVWKFVLGLLMQPRDNDAVPFSELKSVTCAVAMGLYR
jgi:hypothetical protein